MTCFREVLLSLLLALLATAPLQAQDEQLLRGDLLPLAIKGRSNAPQHVEAVLEWKGAGLLRGRLELVVGDGLDAKAVIRTPEVALVRGEQRVRITLPPIDPPFAGNQLSGDLALVTVDGKRIRVATVPLPFPTSYERSLLVGVVGSRSGGGNVGDLLRSLQLEQYRPNERAQSLGTTLAWLTPDEAPKTPLAWCAFDIAVLRAEAMTELGVEDMKALGAWVRGGGAALLLLDAPVPAEHVAMIDEWAREAHAGWSLLTDAAGRPLGDSAPPMRVGLGRLVVLTRPLSPDDAEWRRRIAFLWRLRAPQAEAFVASGKWRADLEEKSSSRAHNYNYNVPQYGGMTPADDLPMHPLPMLGAQELLAGLMPSEVRLVPLSAILLILVGFTLAVGPGDYFLLGLIRRRRWTWVLFPLVAVGFTAATVAISQGYMGRTDHRTSLVITDVGEGGRVLRENRLSLAFMGAAGTIERRLDDALVSSVDHNMLGAYPYSYAMSGEAVESAPPAYVGRVPEGYDMRQAVGQWSPVLTRELRIGGGAVDATLNWDAFDPFTKDPRQHRKWETDLTRGRGFRGVLVAFGDWRGYEEEMVETASENPLYRDDRNLHENYHALSMSKALQPESFIVQATSRQPEGFFSLVSAVSPAGGGDSFEDLAIHDAGDPDTRVVVAAWRDGDDLHMVRRVYHRPAAANPESE